MTAPLRITLAQINPVIGDIALNLDRIRRAWDDAPEGTDLVVFPELAVCGYPPEDLILKPFFLEETRRAVEALTAESARRKPAILVGAPLREDGRTYNAAYLIGGGRVMDTVRKHHLPNYGVFDERRVFASAPPAAPVTLSGHRLGVMICEDMWQDDVARGLKAQGADLLVVLNASPFETAKNETRLAVARARAAETGLPLVYVNQTGGQDEIVFDGASFILDAQGALALQAASFAEDTRHALWTRGAWECGDGAIMPVPDEIPAIYQALVTGLRDYIGKNGFPGVLIGLSGGIDSALSAAIAVDALGPAKVRGVMMPSRYTSADSTEDAEALARMLGIRIDTVPIAPMVESFESGLAPYFTGDTPATTFENIQPRCRGIILMTLSNATGAMVLSTGNKSEMAVGYATLYGDMCGGFNVLKDVYKTQVYALSRWRNSHAPEGALGPTAGRPAIPARSIEKAPTAELKPDQTDQDTLPPYDVLDDILRGLIEQDGAIADIAARGHDRETVRRVWRMLDQAEYKRRQAPPGVKITARAFGRDRRYPITNHTTSLL